MGSGDLSLDIPGVERDVQPGDAGVGRGKMTVVCRSDGDARHGLESLLAGGQSWGS